MGSPISIGGVEGNSSSDLDTHEEREVSSHDDVEKRGERDFSDDSHDEKDEDNAEGASPRNYEPGEGKGESSATTVGGISKVLSRVVTRTSIKSLNPGPPPDGGLQAWIAGKCWGSPFFETENHLLD